MYGQVVSIDTLKKLILESTKSNPIDSILEWFSRGKTKHLQYEFSHPQSQYQIKNFAFYDLVLDESLMESFEFVTRMHTVVRLELIFENFGPSGPILLCMTPSGVVYFHYEEKYGIGYADRFNPAVWLKFLLNPDYPQFCRIFYSQQLAPLHYVMGPLKRICMSVVY